MLFGLFEKRQEITTDEELNVLLEGRKLGLTVTKEEALNVPAIATSINFISGMVASLPIKLYKVEDTGKVEVTDDSRLFLLNSESGDLLDSYQMKKALITDMLLSGVGYAFVNWRGNKVQSINYIENYDVSVVKSADVIFKDAKFLVQGKTIQPYAMLRITKDSTDGVSGKGILDTNGVLCSTMYNSLKYENASMSTGGKKGFLKSENRLQDGMLAELKKAWRQLYSTDANESTDVVVLNKGISFESADSTATENQLNENKLTNTQQVYSIFGLSDALFSNPTAEIFYNAVKVAILPVINEFTVAINKFLLLESEKQSYRFELDMDEILKADAISRYTAYGMALKDSWLNIDDVRAKEGLTPIGFDYIKLGLDAVLYDPKTKDIYTPNTNSKTNLMKGGNQNED